MSVTLIHLNIINYENQGVEFTSELNVKLFHWGGPKAELALRGKGEKLSYGER